MNEIRKVLQEVAFDLKQLEPEMPRRRTVLRLAKKLEETLALLPPEGETHSALPFNVATCDTLTDPNSWYVLPSEAAEKLIARGVIKPINVKEPAPSSEKALREKLAQEAFLILAGNPDITPVDLYNALLASSPAPVVPRPEDVKQPGPRAPSSSNPGPCNIGAPAPEAPKDITGSEYPERDASYDRDEEANY